MLIESLTVGEFQVNCFVVWEKLPEAIVIDPGADPDIIIEFLKDNRLHPAIYLLTHGHCDHVSAVADMCRQMPAPVAIHASDLKWAFGADNQMPPFKGLPKKPTTEVHEITNNSNHIAAGMKYLVLHTPGHTPGSVCFHFPDHDALFSGDTLFAGSVGRTDLQGGSSRELQSSLEILAELPGKTNIYPGHGPNTTILQEKKTNYFMRSLSFTT